VTGLVGFLLVTGIISVIAYGVVRANARRRDALAAISRALGGRVVDGARTTGRRHGLPLTYQFADRGVGSNHDPWTEIDVELGSKAFDDEIIVEAAPLDVMRFLIDADARSMLQSLPLVELITARTDAGPVLRLAVRGWVEEVDRATWLADGVARIASRVRAAYADADAAIERSVDPGDPYRAGLTGHTDDAQAAREREIARVEQVAQTRAERARANASAVLVFVIAAFVLGLGAAATCH